MNRDAIGAIAELLGAIGVIASLVYLGGQIRQNTRSVRGATCQSLIGISMQTQGNLAYDGATSEIVRRGMQDGSQLSEGEAFRFNWFMGGLVKATVGLHAAQHERIRNGLELDAVELPQHGPEPAREGNAARPPALRRTGLATPRLRGVDHQRLRYGGGWQTLWSLSFGEGQPTRMEGRNARGSTLASSGAGISSSWLPCSRSRS